MKALITQLAKLGNFLAVGGFWFSVWLYRALLFVLAGGCIGVLVAPIAKVLFFKQSSWGDVLLGGFVTGLQYSGLWATAVALVWVIMDRKQVLQTACHVLGCKKRAASGSDPTE